ncbi:MAG: hypothetical protein ORN54_13100, partial [Cyclobacteriaceae bacterium]|nr:hypothetical protein [Cyclobacteriaceae bacterium]
MNKEQIKILFLVQLPPPVHGSATISEFLVNSKTLNSFFTIKVLPLHYAKSMKDLGWISFSKIFRMFSIMIRLIQNIREFRPVAIYFTLTPFGIGFYRDILFVTILKLFRLKIIYHLHMKGIMEASENSILRKGLYRYVFHDTFVITLSRHLSLDISKVYGGKPFIVNNGLPLVTSARIAEIRLGAELQLLFLSNFMKAKGIFLFLSAIKMLRDQNYVFHAHIVGSPGDVSTNEIEEFISKNCLTDRVTLEGPK